MFATQPFAATVTIWRDLNGDFNHDPGEATIISGTVTISRACEGGILTAAPTSKEQCKNGDWLEFGSMFKNQGQCVAFVERGPKP